MSKTDEEMVWLCCLICSGIGYGSLEVHDLGCPVMQQQEPYDAAKDFTPALQEAA